MSYFKRVVSWRKGDLIQCWTYDFRPGKVNRSDLLLVMANPGLQTKCYNLSNGTYIIAHYEAFDTSSFTLIQRLDDPPEDDYILESH